MMTLAFTQKKRIAVVLLGALSLQILQPMAVYALTSGPAQPETNGFRQADMTEMVDVSSGNFKYNIPLLDIDGYPVNLNYNSGAGMDDEAGWVGLGWSLTPGAINRQVRGVADDMAGQANGDEINVQQYMKPKVTVGGKLTAKAEFYGRALAAGATIGLFNDNYTGLGSEIGFNAGISFGLANDGLLTAGMGVGVLSNTQTGAEVSLSPYVAMNVLVKKENNVTVNGALSGSLSYNTRSGLKALSTGLSFGVSATKTADVFLPNIGTHHYKYGETSGASFSAYGSSVSYNTLPINPSIQIPFRSTYGSFSIDAGGTFFGAFGAIGGTGYRNIREVKDLDNKRPAYGFLYAERGKDNPEAVMDFIREKDNPVIPALPNLAIPIHTPDLWSFTSQAGSGQFRLYRGGSGAFFDNSSRDESSVSSVGADIGTGAYFHGGVTLYEQSGGTVTGKWRESNQYLAKGDFQPAAKNEPGKEHAYFKLIGEPTKEDETFMNMVKGTRPLRIGVGQMTAEANFHVAGNDAAEAVGAITNTTRRPRRTVISYLTASEAAQGALDQKIKIYPHYSPSIPSLVNQPLPVECEDRVNGYRRADHISELTVSQSDGKRLVYGIPVYNKYQDEYTFAVGAQGAISNTNLTGIPITLANPRSSNKGIDHYYQHERTPAHATSYLLTNVLSPDYTDRTGNGPSDDDAGTAISFHYSRVMDYKWRAPYLNATLNKCLLADYQDDKASVIYGEKELWYLSSIESNTKVAYFLTEERPDGLGVSDAQVTNGDYRNLAKRQRCLREIRLYSKSDMSRPLKVIKFEYTQELCRNLPNSADLGTQDPLKGGKLTLKKVWFEYGNSKKGQNFPYVFNYNKTVGGAAVNYGYMQTDRWGNYKPVNLNSNGLDNESYPYTPQDNRANADERAALWNLSSIDIPGGGKIAVSYEAGDYSYVQDKRAMVMTALTGLVKADGTSTEILRDAKGIQVNIGNVQAPAAGTDITRWFRNKFLNGSEYLYVKLNARMATNNADAHGMTNDFVPVYCKIASVTLSGGNANVFFEDIREAGRNPMVVAAWQRLRIEYPRFAYPGFENRIKDGNGSVAAAVSAIVNAARNLGELKGNFYKLAADRGYAEQIDKNKSYCKLVKQGGSKLGGAARVKQISISDNWGAMSGTSGEGVSQDYGQRYLYQMTENGETISSGVAAYEPGIGTDENALREPVPYVEDIKGAVNNFFSLERPFAESLYPAPAVNYSRVEVVDLDYSGAPTRKSGYTVNEYYTYRDFPVRVEETPLHRSEGRNEKKYSLVGSKSIEELALSQGYSIALNDMQGKPKAERSYNQSGAEVTSTVYHYAQDEQGRLDNRVDIIDTDGTRLQDKVIARETELFTDFREQLSINVGRANNIGVDVIPAFWFPIPIPHFPVQSNDDRKVFRSACALKVIHTFGQISGVTRTVNGASVTTENIAYDGLTGTPIVTRTQNEFNQYIYQVKLPAYWIYAGMGGAYQNTGALLSGIQTDDFGVIMPIGAVPDCLRAGDELVGGAERYWVIEAMPGEGNALPVCPPETGYSSLTANNISGYQKRLIDRQGNVVGNLNPTGQASFKIVRSGYRNLLDAEAFSFTSLENPIVNNKLRITSSNQQTSMKVLNAAAATYNEQWPTSRYCNTCQENTALQFRYGPSGSHADHGKKGTIFIDEIGNVEEGPVKISFLDKRLDQAGVWLAGNPLVLNELIGFDVDVDIKCSKNYWIGFSGDDDFCYTIDGRRLAPPAAYANDPVAYWFVKSVYLTKGIHRLHLMCKNLPNATNTLATNPGAMALEIYSSPDKSVVKTGSGFIFTTRDSLVGKDLLNSFRSSGGQRIDQYACYINPFVNGFYGNWRPYQQFVFQEKRNYNVSAQGTADVRNAGIINNFYGFWYRQTDGSGLGQWVRSSSDRWVEANRVTLYDNYGQQLENRDALGRYSAALYAFNGELPAAVASNARFREIYADGFEDMSFRTVNPLSVCGGNGFVDIAAGGSLASISLNTVSHTGRYSLRLPASGIQLNTVIHSNDWKINDLLFINKSGSYQANTISGLYPKGFQPVPGIRYLFSAWVKDSAPLSKSLNVAVTAGGNAITDLRCKAVVEGWKLIEGSFTAGSVGDFALQVTPLAQDVYLDDLRIHPEASQMKTFAYDARNLRLSAELDENGFATFYEYDDEGLLIRLKKETERGIMTIRENRSSLKKSL